MFMSTTNSPAVALSQAGLTNMKGKPSSSSNGQEQSVVVPDIVNTWRNRSSEDRTTYNGTIMDGMRGQLAAQHMSTDAMSPSADVPTTMTSDGVDGFVDSSDDPQVQNINNSISRIVTGVIDSQLRDLLMRPLKVYTFSWDTGNLGFSFDPWTLWISNTVIQRKLANHFLLTTGGLHIRVVTNGSPFQYGRYGIGYWPFYVSDNYATTFSISDPARISNLPLFSTIDPSADSVIDWSIPEVKQSELSIVAATQKLGNVVGTSIAGLNMAQTGTAYCDMTFYVSAIDPKVQYVTNTNAFYGTSKQSGYISTTLNRIADTANNLREVPLIGQYMPSAGVAARLGAHIASVMGFTRPMSTEPQLRVTNEPYKDMAHADGVDVVQSLSLSSKPDCSLDLSHLGLGAEDQMSLNFIKRRWSLITATTPWNDTDAIGATLLNIYVSPRDGDAATPYSPTNIGYISYSFEYWRGSIEYKFVFCCSKFHTGRVWISYDPDPASSVPANDATPVQQTLIVDLADQREVTMLIPYTGRTTFTKTGGVAWANASGPSLSSIGKLRINVLSKLRGGSNATTIQILRFIRGGPDMEWACPTMYYWRDGTNMIGTSPAATLGANPTNTGYGYLGTSKAVADIQFTDDVNTNVIVAMSERIDSIRELLKRYNLTRVMTTAAVGGKLNYQCIRDMPSQSGYTNLTAVLLESSTMWCHFNYWLPCFAGWKGSIRTSLVPAGDLNGVITITRVNLNNVSDYMLGVGTAASASAYRTQYPNSYGGHILGMSYSTAGRKNVSYSNPWMNTNFFELKSQSNNSYGTGPGVFMLVPENGLSTRMMIYQAAGDDFNFVWYMGPPTLYAATVA